MCPRAVCSVSCLALLGAELTQCGTFAYAWDRDELSVRTAKHGIFAVAAKRRMSCLGNHPPAAKAMLHVLIAPVFTIANAPLLAPEVGMRQARCPDQQQCCADNLPRCPLLGGLWMREPVCCQERRRQCPVRVNEPCAALHNTAPSVTQRPLGEVDKTHLYESCARIPVMRRWARICADVAQLQ